MWNGRFLPRFRPQIWRSTNTSDGIWRSTSNCCSHNDKFRRDPDHPAVKKLLARCIRAWELAEISEFLATVSADVRFSMPPLATWYQGSANVAAFIEDAIFKPSRPNGIAVRMGRANGQRALATYEPGPDKLMIANGLQILDINSQTNTINAITSFRDSNIATRCGLPTTITP